MVTSVIFAENQKSTISGDIDIRVTSAISPDVTPFFPLFADLVTW